MLFNFRLINSFIFINQLLVDCNLFHVVKIEYFELRPLSHTVLFLMCFNVLCKAKTKAKRREQSELISICTKYV